ncbi:hypothetical protein NDU88_002935 [Pleurodeles waltl]|uniref:Uncharacterized protein n=1 Tax=Pleurodeles waltl TaxID=8319 RepID=A0AAV7QEA1_PLEWA|nr:hypothetical protein NDU88_002935 [Pleurodeles waltl]
MERGAAAEIRLLESRPQPPKQQHRQQPLQSPVGTFQLRDPGPQTRRNNMSLTELVRPKGKSVYGGFSQGESDGIEHVGQMSSAERGVSSGPRWESPASEESASVSASSFKAE